MCFPRMYFNQEGRHTYEKFPQKSEVTASGKFRSVFLRAVSRSSISLPPLSNDTGGDARPPEDDMKKSSTYVWRGKDLVFSFRIS